MTDLRKSDWINGPVIGLLYHTVIWFTGYTVIPVVKETCMEFNLVNHILIMQMKEWQYVYYTLMRGIANYIERAIHFQSLQ